MENEPLRPQMAEAVFLVLFYSLKLCTAKVETRTATTKIRFH